MMDNKKIIGIVVLVVAVVAVVMLIGRSTGEAFRGGRPLALDGGSKGITRDVSFCSGPNVNQLDIFTRGTVTVTNERGKVIGTHQDRCQPEVEALPPLASGTPAGVTEVYCAQSSGPSRYVVATRFTACPTGTVCPNPWSSSDAGACVSVYGEGGGDVGAERTGRRVAR
mgnify:CR=1 FL=1